MKCLILSDTHHNADHLLERLLRAHKDAEVIFFLGDGLTDMEDPAAMYPDRSFFVVRGNCDYEGFFRGAPAKKTEQLSLLGHSIVLTHGDLYGAKYGTQELIAMARRSGAELLLFGHTHQAMEQYLPPDGDGGPLYLFNPGSLGQPAYGTRPSYGLLTLTQTDVLFSHGVIG